MILDCICDADSMDELLDKIHIHFGLEVRFIRSEMSLFEQYEVRPKDRIFIPEVWKFRIVVKNGKYWFGRLGNEV